ncbi:anthranilate synthase component I family protein [Halalkalicoccus ordinarius]|uniref:anthranilate synthase component I family protein n=1 Tax=Halalkalicoccus ordinarius TaxID=3116651 RepID=UPI00300EE9D6
MDEGETGAVLHTSRDRFLTLAAGSDTDVRIPIEYRLRVDDPFEAYRRARDAEGGSYLETTGGQPGWGYFGVDPVERLRVGAEAVAIGGGSASLSALQGLLDGESLVRGACTVPYPCGAIGWLSYDVARELESLPDATTDDRGLPRLDLAVYDRLAAWEEPWEGETTLRITACPRIDGDPVAAYDRGRRRALALAERIREGEPDVSEDGATGGSEDGVSSGVGRSTPPTARFESDCGREAFSRRVDRVKRRIRDGETFQANVSQRLSAPAAVHPVTAFSALRAVNPAPYSALLERRDHDLVSASPELLIEVDGDRLVTEPIAGTRPRGGTPEADERYEAELLGDEKERAEHAMLVDLERNDLGKVCAFGTVEVSEYRRVDRYSEVMHLVSLVEGRRREGVSIADALGAVFPGGTITGAPKPRTMAIIDEVETTRRGPYTGSIGIFGFDDRATCNIVIRTLVRHAGEYDLRVGAGIVHDSVPEHEYEETLAKGRALITAIDEALESKRMTVTVEAGE